MVQQRQSEKGQALVLIALGLLALFGFAALAIDGGRVYADRRNMQNASDSSSLAGAAAYAMYLDANGIWHKNWSCAGDWYTSATAYAKTAAINRASSNGYPIDSDPAADFNGVETSCHEVSYGGFTDKYIDVVTYITAETPSSFSQLVYQGPLVQRVVSTARIRPQTSFAFGAALVALNPADCQGQQNGLRFLGNFDVTIQNSSALSMGCLGTQGAGDFVGAADIVYGTSWDENGPGTVVPGATSGADPLSEQVIEIPPPDCDELPNQTPQSSLSGGNISPGIYTQIRVNNNATTTMAPGLYCMIGNLNVMGGGTLIGNGVTIYFQSGDFNTAGNSVVQLKAPEQSPPGPNPDPAVSGLLIYMDPTYSGEIDLQGTSASYYQGTVFAPAAQVEVGGTASEISSIGVQIIGWDVFVHGDVEMDMFFDDANVYQVPPNLDLRK